MDRIKETITNHPLFIKILAEDDYSIKALMKAATIKGKARMCEMSVFKGIEGLTVDQVYTFFYEY